MARRPRIPRRRHRAPRKKKPGGVIVRGVVMVLPIILTVTVLVFLFNFVANNVTTPINRTIYWCLDSNGFGWQALDYMGIRPYETKFLNPDVLQISPVNLREMSKDPESAPFTNALALHREEHEGFFRDFDDLAINRELVRDDIKEVVPPWFSILVSIGVVMWVGWVTSGFVGRKFFSMFEKGLQTIPGIRSVYPYSKQFTEFFFGESNLEFDTVVSLPYPSKGLWSIGFVTNHAPRTVSETAGKELVSVFVPSSPMPMTGYTIFVSPDDLIPLPISVDEALRITVSGGVLIPPSEAHAGGVDELRAALKLPRRDDAGDDPIDEDEEVDEDTDYEPERS